MPDADNSHTDIPRPSKPTRLVSLDAFRGLTVIGMIFMDHPTIREAVPLWLLHPDWHGFRLADTIFSSFLFIAGVSMAFSAAKRAADPSAERSAFARRMLLLILLGFAVNLVKYGIPLRVFGVLQRIALASLIAWPFRRRGPWLPLTVGLGFITVHTLVLQFAGAPGIPAGYLDGIHNISGWIDTHLVGLAHTYKGQGFDPEGASSTLTASSMVLLGLSVGQWLRRYPKDPRMLRRLAGLALASFVCGLALSIAIPINKKLGTGSFTLIMWGIDIAVLAALYWLADVRGHTRWLRPIVPLGLNALGIYVGFNILLGIVMHITITTPGGTDISLFRAIGAAAERIIGDPTAATLSVSALEVLAWLAVATALDRRRIYFKL
ncbi:MAG: heparan-alpha-glucosaminide N-acetyltransferase domain-containing protein [Coriobacteriales bacterium]